MVWSAIYDSFGRCQVQVETVVNNLRFPGQYYDSETDLYYNLNRYYDPTTGRYLRADPFGDGINLYTYCFNNPLLFIDPEGLCAVCEVQKTILRVSGSFLGVFDVAVVASAGWDSKVLEEDEYSRY